MESMRDDTFDDDPEIAEMNARLARHQEEIEQARRDVAALVVKGATRGNEVVATMRGGALTEVSIDPDALRRFDAHDLGALVTEAVGLAQRRVAAASEARFAPVISGLRR